MSVLRVIYFVCRGIFGRLYGLLDQILWAVWPTIVGAQCDGKVFCLGKPRIKILPGANIFIGNDVLFASRSTVNPMRILGPCTLTALKGSQIRIGAGASMSGVVIVSAVDINIGENVMIGANTTIIDTDFHPLDPVKRREDSTGGRVSRAVIVGNDVFIGSDSIILKGTEIGDGAVIGAGSVVCGKFASRTVIAGNPAKVIRTLE